MTRKDYNLLANSLKENKPGENGQEIYYQIVHNLAIDLKHENEKFNYDKFMTACGIENY